VRFFYHIVKNTLLQTAFLANLDGFNVYRISATNLVNSILSKKGLRI